MSGALLSAVGLVWDWKTSLIYNCLYGAFTTATVWCVQSTCRRLKPSPKSPPPVNTQMMYALPPALGPVESVGPSKKQEELKVPKCAGLLLILYIVIPAVIILAVAGMYTDWYHARVSAKVRMYRDHEMAALPHADCQRQPWFSETEQCKKAKFDFELKPDLIESIAFHEAWNHTRTHIREAFESVFILHKLVVLADSSVGLAISVIEGLQHSTIGIMFVGALMLIGTIAYVWLGPVQSAIKIEHYIRHKPQPLTPHMKQQAGYLDEFPPDPVYLKLQQDSSSHAATTNDNPYTTQPPSLVS